ncbi:protein-L-isoaspartate(D-aspartate) O-methyltransferase [candidate division KSB1 bacterium]|nr:protein-L-isoaspartate(D-aspartate) O-methyltransferase [candidate division KSB1 bacterium]
MSFRIAREEMVKQQLVKRGIQDPRLLKVMAQVRRHRFVDPGLQNRAYDDCPLPIGNNQTISQPYMVALMTELLELEGDERVLEIGTGSGYQTAILAELVEKVFSVERHHSLAQRARKTLDALNYSNIAIRVGDGSIGWNEFSPYDRIIVTAGAPTIPSSLFKQLKEGGILLIPVGDDFIQELNVIRKIGGKPVVERAGDCTFVPLIGKEGWKR